MTGWKNAVIHRGSRKLYRHRRHDHQNSQNRLRKWSTFNLRKFVTSSRRRNNIYRIRIQNEELPHHSISRRHSRWSQGPEFDMLGQRESNGRFSEILWKVSHKYLQPGEWKKLAQRWSFTDEQIKAIEHQYTGWLNHVSI